MVAKSLAVGAAVGAALYISAVSWKALQGGATYGEVKAKVERSFSHDNTDTLFEAKITAMKSTFQTGSDEYRGLMEEIARTDDKSLFDSFLGYVERHDDGRFDNALKARLVDDDFHFSRFNGVEVSDATKVHLNNQKIDVVRNTIKAIAKRNQKFAVEQAIKYYNQPGFDPYKTYDGLLGNIGGEAAIDYLITHFDENGLRNSYPLANAVRTRDQAQRVYSFILDKTDEWKGPCKEVIYAIADLKKIGQEFNLGVPGVPYCPQ